MRRGPGGRGRGRGRAVHRWRGGPAAAAVGMGPALACGTQADLVTLCRRGLGLPSSGPPQKPPHRTHGAPGQAGADGSGSVIAGGLGSCGSAPTRERQQLVLVVGALFDRLGFRRELPVLRISRSSSHSISALSSRAFSARSRASSSAGPCPAPPTQCSDVYWAVSLRTYCGGGHGTSPAPPSSSTESGSDHR